MNSENKILSENIIFRLKKSQNGILSKNVLLKEFSININKLQPILLSLSDDLGLVKIEQEHNVRLTDKGWKFKTFDKLEKDSKKTPLNLYQKIYLAFFILFGLFGIYKVFQPTVDISDFQRLKNDFDSLNSRLDSIVKSTSKPTSQKSTDTLQTKNFDDLKTD